MKKGAGSPQTDLPKLKSVKYAKEERAVGDKMLAIYTDQHSPLLTQTVSTATPVE